MSAHNTPRESIRSRNSNPRSRAQSEGLNEPVPDIETPSPTISRDDHHGSDTVVPLEGRILRDAQGKFIFLGDCAPLSFLQTVRHLISSEVGSDSFAIQAARDSIIEVARPELPTGRRPPALPNPGETQSLVEDYIAATTGLVDLFEYEELLRETRVWASDPTAHSGDAAAAVFFLVMAIGAQERSEEQADSWFEHARSLLLKHMCNSMNVTTVQGFTLVAVYMLRAFQPNGAYLYFCEQPTTFIRWLLTSSSISCADCVCRWHPSDGGQCLLRHLYPVDERSNLEKSSRSRYADKLCTGKTSCHI